MGQRTATATVAAVMTKFMERPVWTQAALGRAVGLERAETIRNVLRELQDAGIPLTREEERPHVYWKIAKNWYPGGVLFKQDLVPELLRQLSHLPRSKARDRLLDTVMEQLPARGKLTPKAPVTARQITEQEEEFLPHVEEAAAKRIPLFLRYATASKGGAAGDRHVSVHLIDVGPPARFIATCHKAQAFRTFRVERIVRARVDAAQKFRECSAEDLAAYQASSLDWFRATGPVVACSFFVREPESLWVAENLLQGLRVESVHGGIRVSAETSAIVQLARFVVRLGDAARPETPVLARAVVELARGALARAEAALSEGPEILPSSVPMDGTPARPTSRA